MKITNIRVTPVNIPLELPLLWTAGLYPGTDKAILEVETDEGIVGLGEVPASGLARNVAAFAPRLIGQDPLDIANIESLCVPAWQIVQSTDGSADMTAFGGLEIALWDIRGKAWNQPLYKLLGGAVRKAIPFTEYFGYRMSYDGLRREVRPQDVVDYCLRMREEHGSTYLRGQADPRRSRTRDCHGESPP